MKQKILNTCNNEVCVNIVSIYMYLKNLKIKLTNFNLLQI